ARAVANANGNFILHAPITMAGPDPANQWVRVGAPQDSRFSWVAGSSPATVNFGSRDPMTISLTHRLSATYASHPAWRRAASICAFRFSFLITVLYRGTLR